MGSSTSWPEQLQLLVMANQDLPSGRPTPPAPPANTTLGKVSQESGKELPRIEACEGVPPPPANVILREMTEKGINTDRIEERG